MAKHHSHIPIRTCSVCRTKAPKTKLLRFCQTENQSDFFIYDEHQTATGRGLYLCKSQKCIEKAKKKNIRLNDQQSNILLTEMK